MTQEQIQNRINEILKAWYRRKDYLDEVIRVEERYYPDNTKMTDTLYARKVELADCTLPLQGLLNEISSDLEKETLSTFDQPPAPLPGVLKIKATIYQLGQDLSSEAKLTNVLYTPISSLSLQIYGNKKARPVVPGRMGDCPDHK